MARLEANKPTVMPMVTETMVPGQEYPNEPASNWETTCLEPC